MRLTLSLLVMSSFLALAACNSADTLEIVNVQNKVEHPLPPKIQSKMRALGMSPTSPIMMRIFKEEGKLEVWKANSRNRYQMIASYDICAWSGRLGPKKTEGDRQAPEGFYNIYPSQMNPNSQYYLSFNLGFPNKFDRSHGFFGTNLMVHGACSSAGCYSMTDAQILEIYAFARDAFRGGQEYFQVQAFPFRMTAENMARHRFSPHYKFWTMIKVGYDHFELTHRPPVVDVCEGKYVFNQLADDKTKFDARKACPATQTPPALMSAYSSYAKTYQSAFDTAARRWDKDDYVEPSENERKAMARQGRKSTPFAPRRDRTTKVVIDPKAKVTPTSDAVTDLADMANRERRLIVSTNPDIVASTRSARVAEATASVPTETRSAAAETVRGEVATGIPVPQPNPLRVVETTQNQPKKPFWKVWQE